MHELGRPMVAYLWTNIKSVCGNPLCRYRSYTSEFDVVGQNHVRTIHILFYSHIVFNFGFSHHHTMHLQIEWQPYERAEVVELEFDPCVQQHSGVLACPTSPNMLLHH